MDVEETYELLDADRDIAEYRRRVVLRCLLLLQDQVDKNAGRYSGSMVPNFTSVAELLTVPYADLLAAVAEFPALDPRRPYGPGVN